MGIGGINNGSGYSLGGRPLGVQIGQKSAADVFGGGGSVDNLIAVNNSPQSTITVDENQVVLKGLQDEIDRTLGYRTNLTTAEKQKLADLQGKISDIEDLSRTRTLTTVEVADRADLYIESYAILGKDYVDVSNDTVYQQKTEALDNLLATKPQGEDAKRLGVLKKLQADITLAVNDRGDRIVDTLYTRLRSVNRQISDLTAPRSISQLTPTERRQHDVLVDEINKHAGQDLQLTSEKKLKIERLQATINAISSGGVNTTA